VRVDDVDQQQLTDALILQRMCSPLLFAGS